MQAASEGVGIAAVRGFRVINVQSNKVYSIPNHLIFPQLTGYQIQIKVKNPQLTKFVTICKQLEKM